MALNASGNISLAGSVSGESIALELGRSPVDEIALNDTDVRTLLAIPSGAVGMQAAYAKSRVLSSNITLTNNQLEFVLAPNIVSGYTAGTTAVTLTINSGVYVYSDNTSRAGLTVTGFATGDTISIVNNGFIIGRGGNGGTGNQVGFAGGPAFRINNDVTITNNSYIAGGGGGGGSTFFQGGGGGAGGGVGGGTGGGAGGAPGAVGGSSTFISGTWSGAGGGGRILPGTGGIGSDGGDPYGSVGQATGGGAGGGGWGSSALLQGGSEEDFFISSGKGGAGGAANNAGQNAFASASPGENAGGGGGGWGASGGRALLGGGGAGPLGGAGGTAITANNNAIFLTNTGYVWGSVTGNLFVSTVTLSSNTTNYTFNPAKVTGYVSGQTVAVLEISTNTYLYSTSTATPALTVSGWAAGDRVIIRNNGYIMGMGGRGAGYNGSELTGAAGGPAISLGFNCTIQNNSYIGGGGGGGGRGMVYVTSGGGGAGGGAGGPCIRAGQAAVAGGVGGSPGSAGGNGNAFAGSDGPFRIGGGSGGGGGRIMPGVGGVGGVPVTDPLTLNTATAGGGGGAGGGSGSGRVNDGGTTVQNGTGVSGGSAGNTGTSNTQADSYGGGGGWGAAGGSGGSTNAAGPAGGSGGKAVNLNGYTVTWSPVGVRYGAIS